MVRGHFSESNTPFVEECPPKHANPWPLHCWRVMPHKISAQTVRNHLSKANLCRCHPYWALPVTAVCSWQRHTLNAMFSSWMNPPADDWQHVCERVGERESRTLGMGQLCKSYKQSCVFLMEIRMQSDITGAIEAITASTRAEEVALASIGLISLLQFFSFRIIVWLFSSFECMR